MIARAAKSEITLVAVHTALPPAVLRKIGQTEAETRARLQALRDYLAPDARIAVEADRSVTRGLTRVVSREHAGLLVLGSAAAVHAASAIGSDVGIEVGPGSPAEELIALSREVDVLVIGSRRSGSPARVLLGTTGEQLLHEAWCPVMVVPRRPGTPPRDCS